MAVDDLSRFKKNEKWKNRRKVGKHTWEQMRIKLILLGICMILLVGCSNKQVADEFCKESGYTGLDNYYGFGKNIFDCEIVDEYGRWTDSGFYDLDFAKNHMENVNTEHKQIRVKGGKMEFKFTKESMQEVKKIVEGREHEPLELKIWHKAIPNTAIKSFTITGNID